MRKFWKKKEKDKSIEIYREGMQPLAPLLRTMHVIYRKIYLEYVEELEKRKYLKKYHSKRILNEILKRELEKIKKNKEAYFDKIEKDVDNYFQPKTPLGKFIDNIEKTIKEGHDEEKRNKF